uniref:Retron-type reverse transcriptase n=1 Tax=Triatoma infestans TaxID=30076 RepID=A0A170VC23_TRIIF
MDDIDVVGRTVDAIKSAFLSIEANSRRLGLVVYEEKTNSFYRPNSKRAILRRPL